MIRYRSNIFTNDYQQVREKPSLAGTCLGGPNSSVTFDARSITVPATLDCLGILSGGTITPPTASPLLLPDDFSWVLKFGMMADMLSKETESRDLLMGAVLRTTLRRGRRR